MTTDYGSSSSTSDSDEDQIDSRPRKRLRPSAEGQPNVRRILLQELDLEIALHERLSSAVESRISWARLLQQALGDRRASIPAIAPGLEESAISALEEIEQPCNVIYTPQLRPRRKAPTSSVASTPSVPAPPTPVIPELAPSTSAYSTRNRGANRSIRPPPRKLLFLRNHATHPPQIVKLACPDCGRTDFSSLQGLLNHCRLSHKREFGSHDECVQCCAVLVEKEEDQAWVVANGAEVGGISLPGLRRLFEIAVGGGQGTFLPPRPVEEVLTKQQSAEVVPIPISTSQTDSTEPNTLVTRTLGHHADSPALAPFLGRETKRRHIRVFDEDQQVDISKPTKDAPKSNWRMHYTHRSNARPALDEVVEPSEPHIAAALANPASVPEDGIPQLANPQVGQGSRFHLVARVSIQDLSLWIPPDRRSKDHAEHTHRWRLAMSSPSYSLPLSTYLKKVIITCLTEPPPTTFLEPIVLSKPPFVVTSTTDRPFLGRLLFEWAGSGDVNPPMTVEHWVELAPQHYSLPVLGDEQFFDVELDRKTEFLPLIEETEPLSWENKPDDANSETKEMDADGEDEGKEDPGYVMRLKSLVPQFPLTAKDSKERSSTQVPYTLVTTTQFRGVVYGRRKAIEWGRAHALRVAYEQQCRESPNAFGGQEDIPLTTGDVFHWLEDEDLLPRRSKPRPAGEPRSITTSAPKRKHRSVKTEDVPSELYCRFCGLHYQLHPTASPVVDAPADSTSSSVKQEPEPSIFSLTCPSFNSSSRVGFPIIDVNRILHADGPLSSPASSSLSLAPTLFSRFGDVNSRPATLSSQDLTMVLEPSLLPLVHRSCQSRLSAPSLSVWRNVSRDELVDELAPAAVLAVVAKLLVKRLVMFGCDAYRRDETEYRGYRGRTRSRKDGQIRRLLTPMHVVRGLLHDATHKTEASALLLSLAPVGMALPRLADAGDT